MYPSSATDVCVCVRVLLYMRMRIHNCVINTTRYSNFDTRRRRRATTTMSLGRVPPPALSHANHAANACVMPILERVRSQKGTLNTMSTLHILPSHLTTFTSDCFFFLVSRRTLVYVSVCVCQSPPWTRHSARRVNDPLSSLNSMTTTGGLRALAHVRFPLQNAFICKAHAKCACTLTH